MRVTVFEAEGRAGGKIRSNSLDGLTWDEGANTMVRVENLVFNVIYTSQSYLDILLKNTHVNGVY